MILRFDWVVTRDEKPFFFLFLEIDLCFDVHRENKFWKFSAKRSLRWIFFTDGDFDKQKSLKGGERNTHSRFEPMRSKMFHRNG